MLMMMLFNRQLTSSIAIMAIFDGFSELGFLFGCHNSQQTEALQKMDDH